MLRVFTYALALVSSFPALSQTPSTSQIDNLLEGYRSSINPGISVGIVVDDDLVYANGFGVSSTQTGSAIEPATVFNVASVGKQFTAACIWFLISQGKIDLDDDIRTYLPEMPDYGSKIRIRHLLNHTSGIRNYHTLMDLQGFDYDTEYYNNLTILALASRQRSINDIPGKKVSYSNTNYNLLTIIIERVSKRNLNEFATEMIFDPLGMKSTYFRVSNKSATAGTAQGYTKNGNAFVPVGEGIQESYGAGNLWSSVEDLSKWIAVLNGGAEKFSSLSDFLAYSEIQYVSSYHAQGIMVGTYKSLKTLSHSGYGRGSQAQILTIPSKNVGIIVLTNNEMVNPIPISYKLADLFLTAGSGAAENIMTAGYNSAASAKFSGLYQEINSDMQMEIFTERDTLRARGSQSATATALLPYGPGKFHRKGNENVTYDFTGTADTELIISFGGTPFYFKRSAANISLTDVSAYEGDYYSEELQTSYRFTSDGRTLYLTYRNNQQVALKPLQQHNFGDGARTVYQFRVNDQNKVTELFLSSQGSVSNIVFLKS